MYILHICTCIYIFIYIYTHIYIYRYIYRYIHIYMWTNQHDSFACLFVPAALTDHICGVFWKTPHLCATSPFRISSRL